jgi:hypothetical protein
LVSFFKCDLALDAKGKGVRLGVSAVARLDRHRSVQGHFVFEDHDLLNVIQQELPRAREVRHWSNRVRAAEQYWAVADSLDSAIVQLESWQPLSGKAA